MIIYYFIFVIFLLILFNIIYKKYIEKDYISVSNNLSWSKSWRFKNVKNGFTEISGYCLQQKVPQVKIKFNTKKNVLIMGDSIIDRHTIYYIREGLVENFNVAFLNHPHHCKNIEYWLNEWKTDNWDYHVIFYFDGMHGFPNRVTEEEHRKYTPLLIKRLKKVCDLLIWGNLTPIPKDIPNGLSNSLNGPNTREQHISDLAVIKGMNQLKLLHLN